MTPDSLWFESLPHAAGLMIGLLIVALVFFEIRIIFRSKRVRATVLRIEESTSLDSDGHEVINRMPVVEFTDGDGNPYATTLKETNITFAKPGQTLWVYYRPGKGKGKYMISKPFSWPKMVLIFLLAVMSAFLIAF